MSKGLGRAELLSWTRIEPSKDVLESLVMLGHMASKQVEDPVTQGALGLRNSPRSLELQQQTAQRKT